NVIHDSWSGGFNNWDGESTGGILYGNLIYNNGWVGTDRGHGHAIYTQNNPGAPTKTVENNIMWGGQGFTFHSYGQPGNTQGYLVAGNCAFNNNGQFLIGGFLPQTGNTVTSNYLYNEAGGMQMGGYGGAINDLTITNNIIDNGALYIIGAAGPINNSGNQV